MKEPAPGSIAAPLRVAIFRRIWLASLLSNMGLMIQGVGAAWTMTELTSSPDMVALVQTALMLPMMLLSIPAGAAADMYDRRRVVILALSISLVGATLLTLAAVLDLITPQVLLGSSFLIGSGMALFGPAWQASVSEQVPKETLQAAVALNSISYNIARSFGPAIGGAIVAAGGAVAAFGANAILYLPLFAALLLWRRRIEPSRLPPERPARAVVSGIRYILHSPPIRTVVIRTFLTGVAGASLSALLPFVSRDLLGGDAALYGIMLGMMGVGAVVGALNVPRLRRLFVGETVIRVCIVLMGLSIIVVALSRSQILTGAVVLAAGAFWMVSIALFNIGVQLAVPRWVAGRAVAGFQTAISGGIATGSWIWGSVAADLGVRTSLLISGGVLASSALLGLWLRMREVEQATDSVAPADEPEVKLALSGRSGPVIIELDYRVELDEARSFYAIMQEVQRIRQRNGAYGWSLARDIAEPERWCERFHFPTWNDYLRHRGAATVTERAFQHEALARFSDPDSYRVRRLLERPFGSVRWREDTPDRQAGGVLPTSY